MVFLQFVWIIITCVLFIPILFFSLVHLLYKDRGYKCIDLQDYGEFFLGLKKKKIPTLFFSNLLSLDTSLRSDFTTWNSLGIFFSDNFFFQRKFVPTIFFFDDSFFSGKFLFSKKFFPNGKVSVIIEK